VGLIDEATEGKTANVLGGILLAFSEAKEADEAATPQRPVNLDSCRRTDQATKSIGSSGGVQN
jgi:hypothetical protein